RGRQIRPLANFEDSVLRADFAVLPQISSRLSHEPHGPHVRGPAPAGIQKAAGHWSHAHVCSGLSSQKNARSPAGLCWDAHARPLTNNGLVHASLSMVRGVTAETESTPCAGQPVRGSMMWL